MKKLPMLVLLPGMDGTGDLFSPFIDILPDGVEYQIISYPENGPADYPSLAQILLPELPLGPYVLIAESFGGPLALHLAALTQNRPEAIVLCGSFVLSPQPKTRQAHYFETFFNLIYPLLPRRWIIRRWLLGQNAGHEQIKSVLAALEKTSLATLGKRMHSIINLDERDLLRATKVPLMIITGNQDKLAREPAARIIRDCRPDAVHIKLEAPHAMIMMQPDLVRDAVLTFLTRLYSESRNPEAE